MVYNLKDRKHMFWAQCMQMVAPKMDDDFCEHEEKLEKFWINVNKLFQSGIKRGIFELPIDSSGDVKPIKKIGGNEATTQSDPKQSNKMPCPNCGVMIPKLFKFHKTCGWESGK